MADFSIKEQKLAAARKKLRKFQKKKADVLPGHSRSGQSSPLDLLNSAQETLSSASSTTDISDIGSNKNGNYGQIDLLISNDNSMSQQEPSEKNENQEMKNLIGNNIPASSQSVPYQFQNENSQTVSSHLFNSKSSELYQHTGVSNINRENLFSDRNKIATSNMSTNLFETTYESPDNEGSLCSETDASLTTVIQRKTDGSSVYPSQDSSLKSTTESLRQLSLQISGLVNDADIHDPNRQELTIIELEKRNNELASMFENEKQKSLEYTSLIEELKRTIESQTIQIQGFQKMSITESNGTEVNGLREQLQVHIQTIGILVAEKSELQTSLSHTRYSLEQKSGEVMDLHGRLEASRQHIKAMETSNQELRNQLTKLTESKENDSQQLSNLQTSHSKLSKLCDEMRATTAELTERLAVRTEENKKLNTEITQVRRDYELAQVHIEQLKNNSTEDLRKQFDDLQKGYSESLHQISLSRATLEQAEKEKQQMEQEYKSYASQLASDLEDIKVKLINESKKCEALETKNEELATELKVKESDQQLGTLLDAVTQEKNKLVKEVSDVTESKKELEEKCSSLVRDNGQLSQYLSEINAKYEALEAAVDRNNTYQVDTSQLLQSMQSDKIAASRALSQNKQLKEQLEELQNGFVMMSNKKLELTEKLERELHIKKGLLKEIAQLGEELSTFKQDLLSKQREIENLKGKKDLSGAITDNQTEHNVNGLHHHEDECEHDHHENDHHHEHGHHHHHEHDHDMHDHHHEKGCEHDGHTSHELSMNNSKENGVQNHSDNQESSCMKFNSENERKRKSDFSKLEVTEDSEDSNRALRMAHNALELKFFKCMEKLALLSDEKQELEHLVQQLQLETETVGDYITIYQFQRGVMKQKMQELTLELDLLKTEKLEMSTKLSKLQKLIEELSKNKNFSKEGLMKGVNSIMNEASTDTVDNNSDAKSEEVSNQSNDTSAEKQDLTTTEESSQERSKNETVKQIMELLSEMESSSQLDISTFNRVHPCSHCSGKLITI